MTATTSDGRASGAQPPRAGQRTLPWGLGFIALALAGLIQWHGPSPWSRLDIFSGGYLTLRVLPVLRSILGRRRARVSAESRHERWGSTAAPGWVKWAVVLTVADLAVFLDYGHWHMAPGLERRGVQALGLVLYLAVALWQEQTDRYLHAAFADEGLPPRLVRTGPFRYVRHPRYAAAPAGKVSAALVFASVLGWVLVALWSVLLLRQIQLEEVHLRELFGSEYEEYSQQTARLVPGIY